MHKITTTFYRGLLFNTAVAVVAGFTGLVDHLVPHC